MMDQALTPQQQVVDLDGVEIGTVDRIFRESERETLRSEPIRGESRFGIGYLEVGARVTGLGRTLYVPFSEVHRGHCWHGQARCPQGDGRAARLGSAAHRTR